MMLTTKGRYAVMAMVDIAAYAESGKPVTLAEISGRQDITVAYLEQIFSKLRRCGLVKSLKGPGGGYVLPGEPENIRISHIIHAVEEPIKMTRCGHDSKHKKGCAAGKRCLTHDLWDSLEGKIDEYLRSVTLADVCGRKLSAVIPGLTGDRSYPRYDMPHGAIPGQAGDDVRG